MDADGCMFQSNSRTIQRRHSRDRVVYSNPIVDDNHNDYYDYSDPLQSDTFEYIDPSDNQEPEIYLESPDIIGETVRKSSYRTYGYGKNRGNYQFPTLMSN